MAVNPSGRRLVVIYAVANVLLVALSAAAYHAPPHRAPRVHIRWADDVDPSARLSLEVSYQLLKGERREGTTWIYDLAVPSESTIRRLVADPHVVDTHYIDRGNASVLPDAPVGTTIVSRNPLSRFRDSAAFEWIAVFSVASICVSAVWLIRERGSS